MFLPRLMRKAPTLQKGCTQKAIVYLDFKKLMRPGHDNYTGNKIELERAGFILSVW